ncbi:hypothetical protein [Paenibacillus chitinolyticus]
MFEHQAAIPRKAYLEAIHNATLWQLNKRTEEEIHMENRNREFKNKKRSASGVNGGTNYSGSRRWKKERILI